MYFARRFLIVLITTFSLISISPNQARADNPKHPQVLILHSYHLGYVWTSEIHEAIMAELREAHLDVDVRTEYLDWKHFPTQENIERQRTSLVTKYANLHFDLVVTSDNKATDFALEHRARFLKDAPIVFCGYNGYRPEVRTTHPHVTGVAEYVDVRGTLSLALALSPKTKHIFAICDATETGRAVCKEIKQSTPQYQDVVGFNFLGAVESTDEVLTLLRKAPINSLVLAGPFNIDKNGRFLDLWELADLIRTQGISLPVFHLYKEALGHGVVGGSMMSGSLQGREAGKMVVRILRGESPDNISVIDTRTVQTFVDYGELARFSLNAANVPSNALAVNRPQSFYEQHRELILGGLGVSLCALFTVTFLLFIRVQSERSLRHNTEQLRALIQHMPVLACAFDEDRNIVMWNRACEVSLGLRPYESKYSISTQPLGLPSPRWHEIIELAVGTSTDGSLELEHVDPTGNRRFVRWFSEADRFKVPGWAGWIVGIDTTEQRLAEADRTRLTLAISQTSEGVVILDTDTTVQYVNNAAVELLDRTRDRLLGHLWQSMFVTTNGSVRELRPRHWSHSSMPFRGRLNVNSTNGHDRILECTASPLLVPGNDQMGSIIVLRDITEQLEIEEQLRRNQRMDSLGALAYGIAHDFGNLLTIIVGNAAQISVSKNEELQSGCVAAIQNAGTRGIELVKQLKGFARSAPTQMTPIDVHLVINELKAMLARTLASPIRLTIDLRAERSTILGDKGQLLQVLLNLAINARDAMPQGGMLSFITSSTKGHIDIWVKDTGVGMSRELLSKVFDPFFTTKPVGVGSGMGLAMAYSIVKSHDGTIEPTSEVGVGTTFRLRFPLVKTE
jgi:PAS domain S-box-containing protein